MLSSGQRFRLSEVLRVRVCAGGRVFHRLLRGAEWPPVGSGRASAAWSRLSPAAASLWRQRRCVPERRPPGPRSSSVVSSELFFRVRLYAASFGRSDREDDQPGSLSRPERPTPARRQPRERVRGGGNGWRRRLLPRRPACLV